MYLVNLNSEFVLKYKILTVELHRAWNPFVNYTNLNKLGSLIMYLTDGLFPTVNVWICTAAEPWVYSNSMFLVNTLKSWLSCSTFYFLGSLVESKLALHTYFRLGLRSAPKD